MKLKTCLLLLISSVVGALVVSIHNSGTEYIPTVRYEYEKNEPNPLSEPWHKPFDPDNPPSGPAKEGKLVGAL